MNGQYNPGDVVLGNWSMIRLIGEGSYGRVFKAERKEFGRIYKAAIKIITIPQSQSEIMSVMADGMDQESITAYFRGFVEEMVDEFSLMSNLKGNSNIVSYEDHSVMQHAEGIGWDIIIRMELLTPLLEYAQMSKLIIKDVIQLGIDMCKALELCQKYKIIHRDIKPENIFISENGDFKLGDFGIARTVEKTTSGLSKKGTYTYMAPEIYRGEAYGSSVDIYSLGIVLYRLLNDNRAPFLPDYPAPITHSEREAALVKRISGASMPMPKNADGRLALIVLKACAYDPKDRYSSPMLMRQELEEILYNREEAHLIYPQGDTAPVEPVEYVSEDEPVHPRQELSIREKTVSLFSVAADTLEDTESDFSNTSESSKDGRIAESTVEEADDKTTSDFGSIIDEIAKEDVTIKQPPKRNRFLLASAMISAALTVLFFLFSRLIYGFLTLANIVTYGILTVLIFLILYFVLSRVTLSSGLPRS